MQADRAAQKPCAAWCPAHGSGPTPAAVYWNCKWSALPRRRTSAAGKARTGICAFFAGCAFFAREHLHFCVSCGNIIRQYCLLQAYALVAQPVEHLTFNQRARDSSSLERTKIPRRIVRFLVGFSIFWGSAHFCTLFAHRRESRVFPCIVCILCIVSDFSILFSGEQQAGELTPLLGVHLPDNFQHPFGGDLDAVRQIFFYRRRAGLGGADVL